MKKLLIYNVSNFPYTCIRYINVKLITQYISQNFMVNYEIFNVSEKFYLNSLHRMKIYGSNWSLLNIKEVSKIINFKLRREKILKLTKKI